MIIKLINHNYKNNYIVSRGGVMKATLKLFIIILVVFLTSCSLDSNSKKYTITFESNGGSFVQTITESKDTQITEPDAPTKEGHSFDGWFTDIELTEPYEFNTMPGEDIKVYARWIINPRYKIAYGIVSNEYDDEVDIPLKPGEVISQISLGRANSSPTNSDLLGWGHSSVITSEGRVFTWGDNPLGQLGDGTTTRRKTPTDITNNFNLNEGEKIIQVSLCTHSSAITSAGRIFTWGFNGFGKLGDGTITSRLKPTDITSHFNLNEGEKITQVSLGLSHSSAITSAGRVFTWGNNVDGQLGDGTTVDRHTPTEITSNFNLNIGEKIIKVSLGPYQSSAITSAGRVFTWGYNWGGRLGDGTQTNRHTPTNITSHFNLNNGEKIIQVSTGASHSSAITSEGRIFTWGYGKLGDGSINSYMFTPAEITSYFDLNITEKITQVSIGESHSSAITSEGRIFTWGVNENGQLGDGTIINKYTPIEITSKFILNEGEKIDQISLGGSHSSAITSEGRVFTWGNNKVGQLGTGKIFSYWYLPLRPTFYFPKLLHISTYNFNEVTVPYVPTLYGYEFGGWYSDIEQTIPYIFSTMPEENLFLYGTWIINNYNITYEMDGGINHLNNPSIYTVEDYINLNIPTKEGYTFLGWYLNGDFEGYSIIEIEKGTIDDVVLYAKWEISE